MNFNYKCTTECNFVFIDTSSQFAKSINKYFKNIDNAVGLTMDVQNYKSNNKIFYVSPANSFGFMDGGIDKIYSKHMFRDVEGRIKSVINRHGKLSKLGRPYLPIGSAIIVAADNSTKNFMIAAPTMLFPQDVKGTQNPYYAFLAVLNVISTCPMSMYADIVVPGLCTGYGNIEPEESAKQIYKAYTDFHFNKTKPNTILYKNFLYYITEPNLCEQPNNHSNTEFK